MLFDDDLAGRECLFQDIDRQPWLGIAAHEHVKRGITVFGPAMDRDMRLSQHSHTRHAAIRREVMQMDMQECRARNFNTPPQRLVDVLYVVEPFRPNQVDDEMGAGKPDPVSLAEKVLVPISFGDGTPGMLFFRLGGA